MTGQSFEFDKHLGLPAHSLIIGASLSGKTTLLIQMLKEAPRLFTPVPKLVMFYYDQYQEQYGQAQEHLAQAGIQMELHRGSDVSLQELEDYVPKNEQTLLIIDDATQTSSTSKNLADIAMNGRHLGISLVLCWHTLFPGSQVARTINQNMHYFFFLPCPRAKGQMEAFGRQAGMGKRLLAAYDLCLNQEHPCRYLLVDMKPSTPDLLRLRSRILPSDGFYQYVYIPK